MKRTIFNFSVGNGNCCLVEADDNFVMVIDLNHSEDFTSTYEMLKPFFRIDDEGKEYIDILLITHGHFDHCKGFKEFREKIKSGELIIGTIWHQGYDRRKFEDPSEMEEDCIALFEEIERREKIANPVFGEYEEAMVAGQSPKLPYDLKIPHDFSITILNPSIDDILNNELDCNNLSVVAKIDLEGLNGILFSGDTESTAWQTSIIPKVLSEEPENAESSFLVVTHHGSYRFFGQNRDAVREANPYPENYDALDYIKPYRLILSAESRFPTSRDQSGDAPPHYSAYKWYHKWFRENRNVSEDDKHPTSFIYTADGHVKLEYISSGWNIFIGYNINSDRQMRELGKRMARALSSTIAIREFQTKTVGAYGQKGK